MVGVHPLSSAATGTAETGTTTPVLGKKKRCPSPSPECGEVINGFYMNMRSKFTAPGTSIYYYEALRMPLYAIVMLREFWTTGVRACNHITQNTANTLHFDRLAGGMASRENGVGRLPWKAAGPHRPCQCPGGIPA